MGKISVVGIGPGSLDDMTYRARRTIEEATTVVGYKRYVDLIADALDNPDSSMQTVRQLAADMKELPPTGWVVGSFVCAVKAIAQTGSFENAIVQAVNLGGDADTIGAIAGGLAGAIYGFSAIPERWKNCLADGVRADLDKFAEMAG